MKPGLVTLISGIALFMLGAFVILFLLIVPLFLNESADQQFLVPGSQQVLIEDPGRYYLWNDFQTVYEGRTFNRSQNIPDNLTITVTNPIGETLTFRSNTSISFTSGSSSKNSIGYVDVSDPGKLMVSVSGDTEQRVFSFSQSIFPKMLLAILGGGAVSLLVALAGIGIGIWGLVKFLKNESS